ncbi:anti-sigma factor family protein [Glutamicibacter protophormiae]|uniref:anti-sigma factor family protein n=1 Tax=Glutamicibacter protophormiae TaxID=37930 RepID=UPI003318F7FD
MSEHEKFAQWDAAYVLGALEPVDRRLFEEHLENCERCQGSVSELSALPGLLSRAHDPEEVTALVPQPPADLFEKTARRAASARRRRGGRMILLVAAAVAVVLGIGLPFLLRPADPGPVLALQQVAEQSLSAQVGFESVAWGTRLNIDCDYPAGYEFGDANGPWSYALLVTDTQGGTMQVATWKAVPGKEITLQAATSLPVDQIAEVTVKTLAGLTVLQSPMDKNLLQQ